MAGAPPHDHTVTGFIVCLEQTRHGRRDMNGYYSGLAVIAAPHATYENTQGTMKEDLCLNYAKKQKEVESKFLIGK